MDFYEKFQKIKFDMSKANVDDVEDILNHYTHDSFYKNGINPLEAACLNDRYKQLMGKDHPLFLKEQMKILDGILKESDTLSFDGLPSIYQRLKNNLTGEGLGITIIQDLENSYIRKFQKIKFDMSKANVDDVEDILNHYDQDSVLINGIQIHFRLNVFEGESLNARYKELTGKDHPVFIDAQKKILEQYIKQVKGLSINGQTSIYELLYNKKVQIGDKNHILKRASEIFLNPHQASLEDISSLLNYFDGGCVLIDGIVYQAYNDPMVAAKLNARYKELTGEDHPVFIERVSNVIDSLMKDKQMLIDSGALTSGYFIALEALISSINEKKNMPLDANSLQNQSEQNDNMDKLEQTTIGGMHR